MSKEYFYRHKIGQMCEESETLRAAVPVRKQNLTNQLATALGKKKAQLLDYKTELVNKGAPPHFFDELENEVDLLAEEISKL